MRSVDDLLAVPDPAWPVYEPLLLAAPVPIEILPIDAATGRDCLWRLQVTARSALGALALHTGGLLVDHGWLRVLGGGSAERAMPSLVEASHIDGAAPPALLVGYDILGGRFEVNGADPDALGRPGQPGEICYFAPDSLEWEPLGAGHSAWLGWIAEGGTTEFYAGLRWPGWEAETAPLNGDQGLAIYPFLSTAEAQADLAATSRRPVPMRELFSWIGE